jgi:hypothetical protein
MDRKVGGASLPPSVFRHGGDLEMKRLCCLLFLVAIFCCATAHDNFAQKARHATPKIKYLDPSRIPLTGEKVEDFVPAGWAHREHSDMAENWDLNSDDVPDTTIIITDEVGDAQPALVVLFGTKDGKWRRAGVATRLITPGGLETFGMSDGPQMEIKKGVLNVYQMIVFNGLKDSEDYIHRFRYDPQTQRFLLIGADYKSYSRGDAHDSLLVSENYLTGDSISTVTHYRNYKASGSDVKHQRLAHSKVFLEDAEIDDSKVNSFSIAHAE